MTPVPFVMILFFLCFLYFNVKPIVWNKAPESAVHTTTLTVYSVLFFFFIIFIRVNGATSCINIIINIEQLWCKRCMHKMIRSFIHYNMQYKKNNNNNNGTRQKWSKYISCHFFFYSSSFAYIQKKKSFP